MGRKEQMGAGAMETTLPELEQMLIRTAAAQADRAAAAPIASRQRSRRRLARLSAPRLAALVLAVALLSGTAMAATGVWDPPIGVLTGKAPPTTSSTPVPGEITEVLGILRREQTEADRSAEVEATLSRALFADGIRPHSVRRLAPSLAVGEATILFSAEGPGGPNEPPERICIYRPAFATSTRELPACFSRAKLLAGGAYMNFETFSPRFLEEIERRPDAFSAECDGPRPPAVCGPTSATVVGLVPDGVAAVTLRFSAAPDVTVPVRENYFELALHGAEIRRRLSGPRYLVMLDAEGRVIPPR